VRSESRLASHKDYSSRFVAWKDHQSSCPDTTRKEKDASSNTCLSIVWVPSCLRVPSDSRALASNSHRDVPEVNSWNRRGNEPRDET